MKTRMAYRGRYVACAAAAVLTVGYGCSRSGVQSTTEALQAATDGTRSPFDATPDPEGKAIYFLGIDVHGSPAVFRTSVGGGSPVVLHSGSPLVSPTGIATSADGKRLFVADPGAETSRGQGAVFTLSSGGGSPATVPGSEGTTPAGVEVVRDALWFVGKASGEGAVFRSSVGGGTAKIVHVGPPLREPSGIAVTSFGDALIVDSGRTSADGRVLRIGAGGSMVMSEHMSVGYPGGIALSQGESAVYVSCFDPRKGSSALVRIDLGSRESSTVDLGGGRGDPAGLHRAKNVDVFAWTDTSANDTGTVHLLSL